MRSPLICAVGLLLACFSATFAQSVDNGFRVSIEVADETGAPIPGAKVEIISVASAQGKTVLTNDAGLAQLDLQAGDYDAIASYAGFKTLYGRVNVNAGDSQKLTFTLRVGTFSGPRVITPDPTKFVTATIVVVDQAGALISDVQIRVTDGSAHGDTKTNKRGEVALKLVPGTYALFAAHPWFLPARQMIEIGVALEQTIPIKLQVAERTVKVNMDTPRFPLGINPPTRPKPVGSATLGMIVTNLMGIPVPYAQIGGLPVEANSPFPEADEQGKIMLELVPGDYDVVVTSPMYGCWTRQIQLRDGEKREIRVLLAEATF